jgi:hypothetical protein
MSTKSSIFYKHWLEEESCELGEEKESMIHIYHEMIDDEIYCNISIMGNKVKSFIIPDNSLPETWKKRKWKHRKD